MAHAIEKIESQTPVPQDERQKNIMSAWALAIGIVFLVLLAVILSTPQDSRDAAADQTSQQGE